MISQYVDQPSLPSAPSSSCSSHEDETKDLNPNQIPSSVANVTIIPTATVKGLPYKRKKSNIFALTTNNASLIDGNLGQTTPFIAYKHNSATHLQSGIVAANSRREFRSKSVVSTDPKSPYFLARAYPSITNDSNHNKSALNLNDNRLVEKHRRSSDAVIKSHRKSIWNHKWGDVSGVHVGRPENAIMNGEIPGLNNALSPDDPKALTIRQHYYPEGNWGWIITVCVALAHFFTSVLSPASGFIIIDTIEHFQLEDNIFIAVIIGTLSTAVTLFISPVVVAICRRKSIRLIAILGGLVTALGCLFTSFATQFHQLFVSYGVIVAIGVSMIRDTAVIMIGQYFKRRREFVEIFVIGSSGLGIALMPLFLSFCIRSKNWRFGFQSLALITFVTFFVAVLYRPASLYHPQRRAILHLKSLQKRSRLKEQLKGHKSTQKQNSVGSSQMGTIIEKPPYFDFSVLKSRTIQILLSGTCISAFGTATPLLLMVQQGSLEKIEYSSLVTLQAFMGIGIVLGSCAIGVIIVKNSVECMIARQYLCQASCFMLSATLLAFTALDDYSGYLLFVWIYGFFYGGYQYSLKMFIYEKVRARNFNRAWGYVQFCQSIPIMVGVPIAAFLNQHFGDRVGYYLSSACIALGSLILFFIDAHKKRIAQKRKIDSVSSVGHANDISRRISRDTSLNLHQYIQSLKRSTDSLNDINLNRLNGNKRIHDNSNYGSLASNQLELMRNTRGRSNSIFSSTIGGPTNAELTCISEEIVLDNFIDDSVLNDCITSCNKNENYLMLSEFENNLNGMSEEAVNIIKHRKGELCVDDRAIIEFHEANCPLAKVIVDHKLATNPLKNNSLTSRQKRSSFAGMTSSNHSSDFMPLTSVPTEQCPNCGDELMAKSNAQNDHIIEEEEEVDEDSINSCDKTQ